MVHSESESSFSSNGRKSESLPGSPRNFKRLSKHEGSSSKPSPSHRERNINNPTTSLETLVHLIKGNIGSGCLAIPEAFMHSGLWVGLCGIAIIGMFCAHCMHLVLHCSRELCQRHNMGALSYEKTGEMCFLHGPKSVRKFHKAFSHTIVTFLIMTQLGFCCVYFVFVSQNMYQAVECMSGGTNLSQFDYMLITLIPVMLICFLPDLKYLVPVSIGASICLLTGLIITFYYLIRDLPEVEMKVPAFGSWKELPLYYGTALYAFEAIGLVLPLENNMKSPNDFPGTTGVLNTGMILVICVYASVGFFGYLRYGDTVLGSITLNLPGDEVLSQMVKILMSLAVFLTYPLQFYVPLSILLPSLLSWFSTKQAKFLVEYGFRIFLVLVTFTMAALIPNIGLFTNLVGAVCSSLLVMVFPPLLDSILFWPDTGKYNWKLCKNSFIMFLGLFGFVAGSYTSVAAIIDFLQEGDTSIETNCY